MYIYNVTTKVNNTISQLWLQWIKEEHIPDILATGCFTKATILQLLETDDTDGLTYAIQYFAESKSLYNHYIDKFSSQMRTKVINKWGDNVIAFRSIMQIIE